MWSHDLFFEYESPIPVHTFLAALAYSFELFNSYSDLAILHCYFKKNKCLQYFFRAQFIIQIFLVYKQTDDDLLCNFYTTSYCLTISSILEYKVHAFPTEQRENRNKWLEINYLNGIANVIIGRYKARMKINIYQIIYTQILIRVLYSNF